MSRRHSDGFSASALPVLLLVGLALIITWLAVGDYPVRVALPMGEDSPILFAHYLAFPSKWAGDLGMVNVPLYAWGSLCYAIPYLLYRVGIPPEIPTLLLTYLQNILLLLALWRYSGNFTKSRSLRLLISIFPVASKMYEWIFSGNSGEFCFVYAAQMALPFLVWTADFLLRGREWRAMGCLLICGFIHPGLALSGSFFVALYLLVSVRDGTGRGRLKMLAKKALGLAIVTALFLLPSEWLLHGVAEHADRRQMMELLRRNGHLFPWLSRGWLWPELRNYLLPTLLGFTVLCGWAIHVSPANLRGKRVNDLLTTAEVQYPLLFALYGLALGVGIPVLLQCIFPRFAGILFVFVSPVVLLVLGEALTGRDALAAASACLLLLLLGGERHGLYVGPLLVLFGLRTSFGKSRRGRGVGWGVLGAWALLIAISPAAGRWLHQPEAAQLLRRWLCPGVLLDARLFVLILVLTAGLIGLILRKVADEIRSPLILGVTSTVIALWFIFGAAAEGGATRTTRARAIYEAQVWARDHSPADSVFVLTQSNFPWRTVSLRRAVSADPGPGVVYSGDLRVMAFLKRVETLLGKTNVLDLASLHSPEAELRFAKEFGGNYIVTSTEDVLGLPVAYENEGVRIYSVR